MTTMTKNNYDPTGEDMDDLLRRLSLPIRNHSRRVAIVSSVIAEHTRKFRGFRNVHVGLHLPVVAYLGGMFHDIGKLILPSFGVDDSEYHRHPLAGVELLECQKENLFDNPEQLLHVSDMVHYHHERADGNGFPDGLRAKDIPLTSSICVVADWLDHFLAIDMSYSRGEIDIQQAIDERVGSQFCEIAAESAKRAWPYIEKQYIKWNSSAVKPDTASSH